MKAKAACTCFLLLCCASLVFSQMAPKRIFTDGNLGIPLTVGLREAPFSADVIIEETQTMPNGRETRFVTLGKMFRDSDGRTRTEKDMYEAPRGTDLETAKVRHDLTTIYDPVRQIRIFADPNRRIATISHQELPLIDGGCGKHESQSAPAITQKPSEQPTNPVSEDLGQKEIEGFKVFGTRVTSVGTAATEVTETWFSDDLCMALFMEDTPPPTFAHTVVTLKNVRKGNPDSSLFEPPTGYAIKDTR